MKLLFAVAVFSLLAAVLVAITGVLSPQTYRSFGRDQLRAFTRSDTQSMSRMVVHQSMLGAVADMLDQNRPVNDCKAKLTRSVGYFLAGSFAIIAVQTVIVLAAG
jgi:hypothetical protein